MSLHLFGHRLCLHLRRIWDVEDYRPTFVARTTFGEIRLRIAPLRLRVSRLG